MTLQFHQFAYNSDNYGVLVHDPDSGETACIDAGSARAAKDALEATGWQLTQIWITHHHWDHTDGLAELKEDTGAQVTGPVPRGKPVTGLDRQVDEGDTLALGAHEVGVLHTPGHTLDMVNYVIGGAGVVFTGDTLFAMGCGRIFEGDAPMMWNSLQKLAALPDSTVVYCAHEYTASNAAFALTVDPDNAALKDRAAEVSRLRADGLPTVPTTIAAEKATNPFLRAADPALRVHLGMRDATDAEVFARVRQMKDAA
ncbi:hydroxyacylglutathione hydrolase [Pseudaestuariivita atlantica]|uniref:Hydroxyacylglutathione hydrolase n=1 Tax=Pseudaestuariivita atlantica TaxID=1317121 RepID=A0A0L1JRE8_9RHOB|nr:hydroxyacylglutathione hydrolase [Pseudaestuariivita atlantica]KNG94325.1 hydroxyacylglutathione hydrolase [Pseudaestuariivita atlantica]